ncbi:hypothetical protein BDV95DRAFT_592839 [Massariosphaeria phaeospora]|uniref:Uncharacterized protein n=1 Tax=Massariosphaeria phaeospora TaxID=100035 RepID=A0A7C8MAB8_9PLEO|nr:hypothetical protein BDV95DRAFT_592839 [Massariosphaeria phaeospora]
MTPERSTMTLERSIVVFGILGGFLAAIPQSQVYRNYAEWHKNAMAFLSWYTTLTVTLLIPYAFMKLYLECRPHKLAFLSTFFGPAIIVLELYLRLTLFMVWTIPLAVFYTCMWTAPVDLVYLCLHPGDRSNRWYGERYAAKTIQRLVEKVETAVKSIINLRGDGERAGKRASAIQLGRGQASELSNFLGIYDMLILVAHDLHYIDIMNLRLTSKSVRQAILPAQDYGLEKRLDHLKRYSCDADNRMKCWVCTIQVCAGCKVQCRLPNAPLYVHLERCRAYCTPCYKDQAHPWNTIALLRFPGLTNCVCDSLSVPPNLFQRLANGSEYYKTRRIAIRHVTKVMCRSCRVLTNYETLVKTKKRTQVELKNSHRQEGARCDNCKVAL